jgi:HD-GYP domain-containing protein (c-di-GMP phosphodiesterase class II)
MAEVLSALSYALDLTDGQPPGHSTRCCMLGMRIAREIGMNAALQSDLYYALLLKDSGCSSNASRMFHLINADEIRAKRGSATTDFSRLGWESVQ